MSLTISRRDLLQASAGAVLLGTAARQAIAQAPGAFPATTAAPAARAAVGLIKGEDRRTNVRNALFAIDHQIAPVLKHKRYVVIKPNLVSTDNQLAATHADALRGILDYVSERFRGNVVIAESSAGETNHGFEAFGFDRVAREYPKQKVRLIDLNQEREYRLATVLDGDLHATSVRLAARLMDPEAFVISSAMLKTHNTVVATLSVKNMTLGAPLHQAPGETPRWNDKRKYHVGVRQTHFNMFLTAQALRPFWGAAVLDGFEGMEGNGPGNGTPVPSHLAIASADFVAADRVGLEAMGIGPENIGYLLYCWQGGIGQYDLAKLDVSGDSIASVKRTYKLHQDIERELQWLGPMKQLPPKLG